MPPNDPDAHPAAGRADNSTTISKHDAFIAGAIGGIAPFVVRAAVTVLGAHGTLPPITLPQILGYAFALVVMAAVGGYLARIAAQQTYHNALAIGMSLPSLFQVGALENRTDSASTPTPPAFAVHGAAGIPFISTGAYAQADVPPAPTAASSGATAREVVATGRFVEVSTSDDSTGHVVRFLDQQGQVLRSVKLNEAYAVVSPPVGAVSVAISKGETLSQPVVLPTNPRGVLHITVSFSQPTFGRSFLQAVGVSTNTRDVALSAQVVEPVVTGATGWVYLGKFAGGSWRTRYVSAPDTAIPKVGDTVTVEFPLRLREQISGTQKAVVQWGQKLLIDELKTVNDSGIYARVRVTDTQTPSPTP